ncbi:MAG TPA: ubiquinol-cytochrome c reductase iron-sulfur subunit [Ktedonobacterales bacterium]
MSTRYDDTTRTPQEYEVLTGGGAEAAEIAKRGISRRQMLRRAAGLTLGVVGAQAALGSLMWLYPNLKGQFGSAVTLKAKSNYTAAEQKDVALDQKGMFYEPSAKAYIMHLKSGGTTQFLLSGTSLQNTMDAQDWVKDQDGTYWLALYQVCVHLGCKVPFRDDCNSFKCPCHGSHYNIDGEYLDGPAPRSLDRFTLSFDGSGNVVVDTGKLNQHVQRPDVGTRLLRLPYVAVCSAQ